MLTVLEFLGKKNLKNLNFADQPDAKKVAPQNDSFGNQLPPMHQQQRSVMTEEYKVPDGMVGFIIGRGGEQISRIQQESGCKIQIAPGNYFWVFLFVCFLSDCLHPYLHLRYILIRVLITIITV